MNSPYRPLHASVHAELSMLSKLVVFEKVALQIFALITAEQDTLVLRWPECSHDRYSMPTVPLSVYSSGPAMMHLIGGFPSCPLLSTIHWKASLACLKSYRWVIRGWRSILPWLTRSRASLYTPAPYLGRRGTGISAGKIGKRHKRHTERLLGHLSS